ncbi:hypothetical protein FBZ84_101208 [Azospirillum baldaniorum]|uniref:hypothetical protein n=1 Tax=Azospirillum baldaniorum TaxID=1064539 RepID=UPI00119F833D|nr:hypothetical protein [Azospirillum baldaniorum]TWA71941.1 hypothetical protein FBZ84_101208 [Azospirillum baldaniorum]
MTTREALISLIERLENATEPSLALDREIGLTLGYQPFDMCTDMLGNPMGGPEDAFPDFTSSLDAAMILVPKDYGVDLRTYPRGQTGYRHTPIACVLSNRSNANPDRWDTAGRGDAATPALALCIAALRARAKLLEDAK